MMAHPRHALMLHAEARIRPAEPVIGAEILLHMLELRRHPDHGAERDDMQALAERAVVALEIVDIRWSAWARTSAPLLWAMSVSSFGGAASRISDSVAAASLPAVTLSASAAGRMRAKARSMLCLMRSAAPNANQPPSASLIASDSP